MAGTVYSRYAALIREGVLERNDAQEGVVAKLDVLRERLVEQRMTRKTSALGWMFGARKFEPVRGLYIWGGVGRGKTMLMDLFFDSLDVQRKRRAHFHAFMADVHARIYDWRQKKKANAVKGDDPIAPVAQALAEEAWLLCFDEFAVTDIADAMILGRLFQALFAAGVVVVATSNVAPENLYRDGLNRALFLPFIGMIEQRMDVVNLESQTDFRLHKLSSAQTWFSPLGPESTASLRAIFRDLTGRERGAPTSVSVFGRQVAIPEAAANVAFFQFADLCEKPLGASDFVAIARDYETVLLDGVPKLNPEKRNDIKRFIVLIDALYDYRVKLIAAAAAPAEALYDFGDGGGAFGGGGTEAFEFARTLSRLVEMRSTGYLALPHGSLSDRSADAGGIVET
ncbi:MAG: AFG1 family ATPase [Hyphomicrobiales bacterium]|nr:AFG1 family ATPase [Hyphomicrobiales bacterium]